MWTRRRLLTRLAATLGAAVALPPALTPVLPTEARELLPARSACACGGGRVQQARAAQAGRAQQAARAFENRVGWAYSPRWRKPRAEVVADLRRMRDLGCNTIYIGHNSAGDANPDAFEPGLAPATWYAIAAATPSADNARIVVATITTCLDAAREVGLDVLLGIGYQIMMGDEWNAAHPDDLRRNREGVLLMHWGSVYTASPYSEVYRRDIREYYGWVNQTFVQPNPHVVALNLADEPMGSDFSSHAMAAFQARYGVPFQAATNVQRGEFLTGVIPDYAELERERLAAAEPRGPHDDDVPRPARRAVPAGRRADLRADAARRSSSRRTPTSTTAWSIGRSRRRTSACSTACAGRSAGSRRCTASR